MKASLLRIIGVMVVLTAGVAVAGEGPKAAPFPYVWAEAYHVLPETTTNESGYFSLCTGLDGSIYVGTTSYGINSYLVEFDPVSETQKIVIDTHKLCGLSDTGYAAQAKIHTRNYVGKSGKIYVGSKQGYPTEQDKKDKVEYPGGYVMTYDPRTGVSECLGMPYPKEGVIDVTADEERGLIYVVTCEEHHWMLYDVKTKKYRELGPMITMFGMTLVDAGGRANVITKDSQLAQYDPATGKIRTRDIVVNGKKVDVGGIPTWILTKDRRRAYLIQIYDPNLFEIDLMSQGDTVSAVAYGSMLEGENPKSTCSLTLSPDGKVYATVRVDNETGFGGHNLHHLTRFDPASKKIEDLGVLAVKNPDFFTFEGKDGKKPPFSHGYHTLPDGTLTPLYSHHGLTVVPDGTLYATILYPYTLLRIDAFKLPAAKEGPGAKYIDAALALCDAAEAKLEGFTKAAEIVADRHIAGGVFNLPWNAQSLRSELKGRSGFLMHTGYDGLWKKERSAAEEKQDVAVLGWDGAPGDTDANMLAQLRDKGSYIIGFGPRQSPELADVIGLCDVFFDNGLGADDRLVTLPSGQRAGRGNLLANAINGWVFSAEMVAAMTRRGKMPIIWKSYMYEDGKEYGDQYFRKKYLHDDLEVAPIARGSLGREVLAKFRYHLRRFKASQSAGIEQMGELIAAELQAGRKTVVASTGHMSQFFVATGEDREWAIKREMYWSVPSQIAGFEEKTAEGALVLRLGYMGLHRDVAAIFKRKKHRVLLITAESTRPEFQATAGFSVEIDMGYAMGDACVTIEGYPVRLFPPSGVMQAVAYEAVSVEALARLDKAETATK